MHKSDFQGNICESKEKSLLKEASEIRTSLKPLISMWGGCHCMLSKDLEVSQAMSGWNNLTNYITLKAHVLVDNKIRFGIIINTKFRTTFAMSGSDDIKLTNLVMAATESSIPSSILISKMTAPFSTWVFATANASWRGNKNNYYEVIKIHE